MSKKTSFASKLGTFLFIIFIIAVLLGLHKIYKIYYFNDFYKAEAEENTSKTKFIRDGEVKYSDAYSYKMQSDDYNDAMFYKTVNVEKNTSYKVSCMVKTENIITENEVSNAGAQICLSETAYSSKSITGTNDWQELEFVFNSKNSETVDIGFRLGGNYDNCKGIAWFSDFKLEKGTVSTNTDWNMVCFILKNTDVIIEQNGKMQELKFSMSSQDVESMKDNMARLKNTCYTLSDGKMSMDYKIIEIDEPIKSVSYDADHGYYVDPVDVKGIIDSYVRTR